MATRPIGATFVHNDELVQIQRAEAETCPEACNGCMMFSGSDCTLFPYGEEAENLGNCSKNNRSDKTNIIFKKTTQNEKRK